MKTPDGETKGYAAYDPETLVPENLAAGVVVGDVEGALSVPRAVETVVDLDFSAGDMEVLPDTGALFSKVNIPKPANLVPENIPKDMNIAGIVGTLESGGGGGLSPFIALDVSTRYGRGYYSTNTSVTKTITITLPANSVIHSCHRINNSAYSSSSSSEIINRTYNSLSPITPTVTDNGDSITVTAELNENQRYNYAFISVLEVLYSVPGLYSKTNADGTLEMYADETCVELPSRILPTRQISRADLSNGAFTSIPSYMFYGISVDCEILLPATIQSLGWQSMNYSKIKAIDFSKCTSVPTLDSGTIRAGTEIRVPAALYDEWIAATNWASLADYIVAV